MFRARVGAVCIFFPVDTDESSVRYKGVGNHDTVVVSLPFSQFSVFVVDISHTVFPVVTVSDRENEDMLRIGSRLVVVLCIDAVFQSLFIFGDFFYLAMAVIDFLTVQFSVLVIYDNIMEEKELLKYNLDVEEINFRILEFDFNNKIEVEDTIKYIKRAH